MRDASLPTPDQRAVDAAESAGALYSTGLNCSESVLRALNETANLGLPTSAYGIATPFGGGFGGAKCACGALTGGLMALGLALGRSDVAQSPQDGSGAGRELHDRFVARFQSACCRDLTSRFEWDQPERRASCEQLVRFAAQTAASIANERG